MPTKKARKVILTIEATTNIEFKYLKKLYLQDALDQSFICDDETFELNQVVVKPGTVR
jgi:hypothetical protein